MQYQSFTAQALGLSPAAAGSAGAGMPATSPTAHATDKGSIPWHPDSPLFWIGLVAGATALGIFGAEVGARLGPVHGEAGVGKV